MLGQSTDCWFGAAARRSWSGLCFDILVEQAGADGFRQLGLYFFATDAGYVALVGVVVRKHFIEPHAAFSDHYVSAANSFCKLGLDLCTRFTLGGRLLRIELGKLLVKR